MSTNYFNESFDFPGYWWTPNDIDNAKPGRLIYDPAEGLRLTLLGAFEVIKESKFPAPPTFPLLLGRITDTRLSSYVTLAGCHRRGGQGIVFSIATDEFMVERAYFGTHFESEDEFQFGGAGVYLDHLEYWVVESTIAGETELKDNVPVRHEIRFEQTETRPIKVGQASVRLSFLNTVPLGWARAMTVTETPYFSLKFTEKLPIDAILRDFIFPLQNLSTFATDHPNRISALVLKRADGDDISMLFSQIPGPSLVRPLRYAEEMLFVTRDLPLERIVPRWLEFAASNRDLVDLYFSVVYNKRLLHDASFFMLAETAELFHRETIGGTRMPAEKFAERCTTVLRPFAGKLRVWLKRALRWANELSFVERLRALVQPDKSTFETIIGDTTKFTSDVADTRNYMAHRTKDLHARATHDAERYRLSERLRLLLKACFLRQLGAEENEREAILKRHVALDRIVRK